MPLRCPRCRTDLVPGGVHGLLTHGCPGCGGQALTASALRRIAPARSFKQLWNALADGPPGDPCPSCARPLAHVPARDDRPVPLDGCRGCQSIWFDAEELAAFAPERLRPRHPDAELTPAAREVLAMAALDQRRVLDEAEEQRRIGRLIWALAWWT